MYKVAQNGNTKVHLYIKLECTVKKLYFLLDNYFVNR